MTQGVEQKAGELLAAEYEKGGTEGSYPTYAALARAGKGAFTLCSIRAIIAALNTDEEIRREVLTALRVCDEAFEALLVVGTPLTAEQSLNVLVAQQKIRALSTPQSGEAG
jgi:hypothetical protein